MPLKRTPPEDAKNRYLKDKEHSVTKKTLYNYDTTLTQFCEWLDERNIGDLPDLDSDHLQQFREYRLSDVATITARNDMVTVRGFIEFCETIQTVPKGHTELVRIPKTDESDEICDDLLTREEAKNPLTPREVRVHQRPARHLPHPLGNGDATERPPCARLCRLR